MKERFYLTTAIAYVNAPPHIGYALECVQADAIARYQRLSGKEVFFLTGTDENSLNAVLAAERAGMDARAFVGQNAERFKALKGALDLSYDDFIRTTEARHFAGTQKLWKASKPEDIYKKTYSGLYCVGCEAFYTEKELVDGRCPDHKTKPEWVEEENYFFRLSAYAPKLKELIESDALRIIPIGRKNELLSQIAQGLEDLSISRSQKRARGWGVPVPGDESQIIYVWYDALANYITALGYAEDAPLFRAMWQENPNRLHVIGKGIIRFHALYWPAMLMSAGLPIPRTIFVHGYITFGGEKMSKSLGNVIDPFDVVEKYGTDAVRYYLLREIPAYEDGDFTYSKLEARYNADLANNLGNLLNRAVSMVDRYRGGVLRRETNKSQKSLKSVALEVYREYNEAMQRYEFHNAVASVWRLIHAANLYIQESKPWDLFKEPARQPELDQVLYESCESLRITALLLHPILPATAAKIWQQLGIADPIETQTLQAAGEWGTLGDGTRVHKGDVIFPRRDK
jgi:methionyl-tRNA synthetase